MPDSKEKMEINIAKINANDSIASGKNSPRFVVPANETKKPPAFDKKIKTLELDLAKINEEKKDNSA